MDDDLRNLLSTDLDFFPLTQPTTLQARKLTRDTPTEIANIFFLNLKDDSTPPSIPHRSLPAQLFTPEETNFPRPPKPFFSKSFALAQLLPQTQMQPGEHQNIKIKPPFPPKTTTVKPSVNIQVDPTSLPIVRLKSSVTTSSLHRKLSLST